MEEEKRIEVNKIIVDEETRKKASRYFFTKVLVNFLLLVRMREVHQCRKACTWTYISYSRQWFSADTIYGHH